MDSKENKSKWSNIRCLKTDIISWTNFLNKHSLGTLPSFAKKAILAALSDEKKRLK